jgi:hypothetical protein
MSYRQLVEGSTNLIVAYIQANIAAALDKVALAAGNPHVSLENPKEYFIYAKPHGYKPPSVFVICDEMDFRIQEHKANFINAKDKFKISILIEDQDADNITYKSWRYLSALDEVLDEASILSGDSKLALKIIVYRASFTPIWTRQEGSGEGGKFRREIVLECEVEHNENF